MILRHWRKTSSFILKIKQESSFMGGGSLASLFHHFLPEISIALKNRGLISGTSQCVMDRDWNLGVFSGFLTLREE
jgi:hypothetical protein